MITSKKDVTEWDIGDIKKRANKHVKFTDHARIEMIEDNISVDEVLFVINTGEIIEEYPDDKPFPSCLIYGGVKDKHVHVVCAMPGHVDALIIITVYKPHPQKWVNYKRRKK